MRKIHNVLRLHFGPKLPQRQIARSIQLSQSAVSEYRPVSKSPALPEGYDDRRLQQKLFSPGEEDCANGRPMPDFAGHAADRGRPGSAVRSGT